MQITHNIEYCPETGVCRYTKRSGKKRVGDVAGGRYKAKKRVYLRIFVNGQSTPMHRVIMKAYGHKIDGMYIDHINGDSLDNRLCNLRVIHPSDSSLNLATRRRSKTGVAGVSFVKGKFESRVTKDGKPHYLGRFETLEEAKNAQNKLREKFGFHVNHGRKAVEPY